MPVAWPAIDEAANTCEQSAATEPRIATRRPRRPVDRRRYAGLLARVLRASYLDPLFERPDLVEDDYYRFLHQPRG